MTKIDTSRDEYIKAIFELMEVHGHATNKQLADFLQVTAASVTEMIKRLVETQDVYLKKKAIYLTDKGMQDVKTLLTKHRLWEIFLVDYLGYAWDEVHEDADALEHATSEHLKDKLNAFLNNPRHCPHGNEIFANHPKKDHLKPLSAMDPGEKGVIHKVSDDKILLRYLEEKNLCLYKTITVKSVDAFDGSIWIESGGQESYVARKAAERIMMICRSDTDRITCSPQEQEFCICRNKA